MRWALIFATSKRVVQAMRRGILAGETDVVIAKKMVIVEPSVRKFIERICQEFGLEKEHSDGRRYKRSDLRA